MRDIFWFFINALRHNFLFVLCFFFPAASFHFKEVSVHFVISWSNIGDVEGCSVCGNPWKLF